MAREEREDPYRNMRFKLEIGGITQAGFSDVTIPDTSSDPIEYREGDQSTTVRKLSGLTKYGNITLKWGMTKSSIELFTWRQKVIDGKIKEARQNIAIVLQDEEGNPAARWEFVEAWPSKYSSPTLSGKGNDVAIETLEIVHEGMKRVQ